MSRPRPGDTIDGFIVGECLHAGAMAYLHAVRAADGGDPGFPLLMKLPRMTPGDGAENIVSFEVEHQMLQVLVGPHVPRFVAAGDLDRLPYLVMEHVAGQTLAAHLEGRLPLAIDEITRLGQVVATALHSLHLQNACHLDLKPANVLLRPDGSAVLIDFGLSCHAHYPDLLAEELRPAVGSPAWMAPEQVVGVRGDARSDLFALGVMLYEMATGALPFGSPSTQGGLRQRLWMDPRPPRALRPELPEALQELILRCLAPEAANRPPSAAHLAFDLGHLSDVRVSELGRRTQPTGFWPHLRRWLGAAGRQYAPSPLPSVQATEVPILMVAVPHHDVTDATLYSLREAVSRSLGLRPGARLACVTVISPAASSSTETSRSETALHRQHLARLRRWAEPLDQADHQASFHVLESTDVADALLRYAEGNHVSMIILGAATHGLAFQRLLATVPIRVAMHAPCTVILVKQSLPFDQLALAPS